MPAPFLEQSWSRGMSLAATTSLDEVDRLAARELTDANLPACGPAAELLGSESCAALPQTSNTLEDDRR
jgi:hypothetical protein